MNRSPLLLLAALALAGPAATQSIGTPIAAHPGDTLHLTYVVAGSPTAIRVVTSSGKILVQSRLTITARPAPPPIDTTPAPKPPVDTTPVPPPPPPVAGTPWLFEDFTEYGGSTATFKADPRHIWSVGEDTDFPSIGVIDTVGGASWRLDFPDRTGVGGSGNIGRCTDYSTGRNLNLPAATGELWLEVVVRFTPGFTTKAPASWGCTSNADYKLLLGRVYTSGRFNIAIIGTYCCEYTVGYPGGEDNFEGGDATKLFDGQWHTLRAHLKVGSGGASVLWADGVLIKDYGAVAMAGNLLYGLATGRNMNQGPDHPESVWWKRIAAWQTNPGW